MRKLILSAVLLFAGVQASQAQDYIPDRPGFANGSFITPEGVLGVEAGIAFQFSDFVDQFSIGEVLVRYGINEDLELRANLGSYNSLTIDNFGTNTGTQDISVGAKYNLVSGEDQPNVSAIAGLSLPTGSDFFTNDEVVPSLGVLADHTLNEMWSLSSNLGYSFGVGNLDDRWLFTVTPSFLVPSNESLAGYLGYAGFYFGQGINMHWLEGGMTYQLESGAQLDVNLGYETEGETFLIGLGYAIGF